MTAKPKWKPSRAAIVNGKHSGHVLFTASGSYVEHLVNEQGPGLGDLGLDDAPVGVSIWEGDYVWRSTSYEYPMEGEEDPVGTFRQPTESEWKAIREGRNPLMQQRRRAPVVR